MWEKILESVLVTIITGAISTAVGFLISYLRKKAAELKAKSENEFIQGLVDVGCSIITDLVNATTQSVVSDLKKGGLFTKDKAAEVFNNVKEAAKNQLSEDMIKAIELTYNVNIDDFLSTKIESIIEESK